MPTDISYLDDSGIYGIVRRETGDLYIGRSWTIRQRWYDHKSRLRRGIHHAGRLQAAWDQYGEAAFDFVVLERVAGKHEMLVAEQRWLGQLEPAYNVSTSSRGGPPKGHPYPKGFRRSPEAVAKTAATNQAFWDRGGPEAEARRAKLSAASKGQPRTPEWRAKISAALVGLKRSPETIEKLRARRHSPEARAKISAAARGRKRPPRSAETRAKLAEGTRRRWALWRAERGAAA